MTPSQNCFEMSSFDETKFLKKEKKNEKELENRQFQRL